MTTAAEPDGPLPPILQRHRMRIALEYGNVSVGEMAETLGVGRNTVGNYLAGRTEPRMRDLRVWSMRTGVSLGWIQTGKRSGDGDRGPDLGVSPSACYGTRPSRMTSLLTNTFPRAA